MISSKFKCIFIHIPKTGGGSVEKAVWQDFTVDNLFGNPNRHQAGGLQHLSALQVKKVVGDVKFSSCFKFSIVRNPWSKAISQYFYTLQKRRDLREILQLSENCTPKEYIRALLKVDFDSMDLANPKRTKLHPQWEFQHRFICDQNGEIMVDRIFRFENLQEDFDTVAKIIKLENSHLVHRTHGVNRPAGIHYSSYYDAESRDIIKNIYKSDIDLFEYEFEQE